MGIERKKGGGEGAPDLDLLPVMSLMTVLIPLLLSMAAFQKMAVVEVNMPERSMMNMDGPPPEPNTESLNLTVAITDKYLEIWAQGGSLPKIYAHEVVEYRCADNVNVSFRYHPKFQMRFINQAAPLGKNWVPDPTWTPGPAKCMSGTLIPDTYAKGEKRIAQKENIFMFAIDGSGLENDTRPTEEVEADLYRDPKRMLRSVYNANDSAYLDGNNQFFTSRGLLKPGMVVQTLRESSARKLGPTAGPGMDEYNSTYEDYRSAYDELAKVLVGIHNRFIDMADADNIIVLADDDVAFDKVIQVMDAAREAGFWNIQLAKLGGA